jgi:hypothetical protein
MTVWTRPIISIAPRPAIAVAPYEEVTYEVLQMTLSAILALAVMSAAADGGNADPPKDASQIGIVGNMVLKEQEIRAFLGVKNPAKASDDDWKAATIRIRNLYRDQGYTLAKVTVKVVDGRWFILIDEGHIDRIIIVGASTLQTLQIRSNIYIPFNIFKRDSVEQQVAAVKKKFNLFEISYKVDKYSDHDAKTVFQLPSGVGSILSNAPPELESLPIEKYDLIIQVRSSEWSTGLGFGVNYNAQGIVGNVEYSGESLIFKNDRHRENAAVGFNIKSSLIPGNPTRPYLTIGEIDLYYYTPPLIGKWFRPHLDSVATITEQQRPDIPLDSYRFFREELSANAGFEVKPGIMLSSGAGLQFNNCFDVHYIPGFDVDIDQSPYHRYFFSFSADLIFPETSLRNDQRHRLRMSLKVYMRGTSFSYLQASADYQKVFHFGYDTLTLNFAGLALWGYPFFSDEYSITYGPFNSDLGNLYIEKALWQSVDYGLHGARSLRTPADRVRAER